MLPVLPAALTTAAAQEEKRKMQLKAIVDIVLAIPSMVVAVKDTRSSLTEGDFSGAANTAIDAVKTGPASWAALKARAHAL